MYDVVITLFGVDEFRDKSDLSFNNVSYKLELTQTLTSSTKMVEK